LLLLITINDIPHTFFSKVASILKATTMLMHILQYNSDKQYGNSFYEWKL